MKYQYKALLGLQLLLGIILLAVGGSQSGGLRLLVQQIETIGPRQWLGLMAGSIALSMPAVVPVTQRIARAVSHRRVTQHGSEGDVPPTV
jgi:hypothetical protein